MQVVQSRSLGARDAVQTIWRGGGLRGFFRWGKGGARGDGGSVLVAALLGRSA